MTMATTTRWDLFQDLHGPRDPMNQVSRVLAEMLGREFQPQGAAMTTTHTWAPALDICERKDAYLVTVELPGVKVDDLEISFEDGMLTIQGERHLPQDSSDQQYHRLERRYGAFRRSITLPLHVVADGIEATTEDGVLQVLVPKAEEVKPKRIEVRRGRVMTPTLADAGKSSRN